MERPQTPSGTLTALEADLVGCRYCAQAWPLGTKTCGRCGGRLASRDPLSLQRVWAWLAAGLICYIPANTEPMLVTETLLHDDASTIVGGAVELFTHGSPLIAVVILIASVGIPVAKFLSIAFLALSIRRRASMRPASRHRLYHVVEYIGRWSMIDVFVVAILSSLVQFSAVATVKPGPASLAFALSVIFTMISAQSFDSRRIWDGLDDAGQTA
ncbi:MAG: paraquat-inducible membrane protein A [Silicimonas sp.]|nr:paraquat-inducible membrane protein A [Silicimonas sp.]